MHRWPLVLLLTVVATRPGAAFVLGGGFADTDCTIAFGGVEADAGASGVVCVDGDPACDGDGVANGGCAFAPSLCSHVTADGCGTRDVDSVRASGLALEPPPLDVDGACGAAVAVTVATGQATGATAIARGGAEIRDVDYLNLCCIAGPGTADAAACAVAVDLAAAGCRRVPPGVKRPFLKARRAIARVADGAGAARLVKQTRRALDHARTVAQRFAERDACGNALGLIARHAADVLPAE